MKLTKADVQKVAKLSSLTLTKEEIKVFTPQLSAIIGYISKLSDVDTNHVEPTAQTTGLESVFAKDEIDTTSSLSLDEALSGTDNVSNGYFVVDRVIDK